MFTPYADKGMLQVMSEDGPLKNGEMGQGVKYDLLWKKTGGGPVKKGKGPAEEPKTEFRFKGALDNLPLPKVSLPFIGNSDE